MPSHRHLRVRELLKREIGEVLRRELPLEEVGVITVNEVGLSSDLHSATVHVGIVGTAAQQDRGFKKLQAERGRIQGLVGRAVILKYTPHLRFVMDDSVERASRVLRILEDLEREPPSATS